MDPTALSTTIRRAARRALPVMGLLAVGLLVAACTQLSHPARPAHLGAAYAPRPDGQRLDVAGVTELGRAMFFDPSLSASGRVSCASCHDPRFAFGPPNDLPVQPGGLDGLSLGVRAAPSLRYLQTLAPFTEHHYDNDGDDSIDAGPTGGHTWDGRASSAHDQARLPLLSPTEMANGSPAEVVEKLRRGPLAERLRALFGARLFDDPARAFDAALMALEVFQQSPRDFYPYSSRYDEVLRGRAVLSEAEARGLALFNDEAKGNCAACHLSVPTPDGAFPLFTDFGLIALGIPRNARLPANADAGYHDLGLCGPIRTDLRDRPEYCGLFRTPTLRNIALRQSFFHNGVFHTLEETLRFYARRDTHPQDFYPRGTGGAVLAFDDLPAAYRDNLNQEPPFGRQVGGEPALTEPEIADMLAFLQTLTDADLAPRAHTAAK
ncbi:MAG TPA: cytochrome c peroxidase [Ideonella sp.]|nr:cytochrome c peroxidase [Ideonella sp.]